MDQWLDAMRTTHGWIVAGTSLRACLVDYLSRFNHTTRQKVWMVLDTRKSAVCGRSFTLSRKEEVSNRWPHIERFLRTDCPTGWVDDEYHRWHFANEEAILPCAEVAAALDEWADFYEWRLEQRADELASDRTKRHIVEVWTDSMVYCCQRWAARARGEDPGEWISPHGRAAQQQC